ncbi:UNVERIFIED_CONTAM: hypothetical protein Sradi_3526500 [Sesamum radiatum]|uniref:Uncharacterized protein n=1 Tax=Sesamum radiatum TaxID=300843 RepID=A0AAW2QEQ0_SESRA
MASSISAGLALKLSPQRLTDKSFQFSSSCSFGIRLWCPIPCPPPEQSMSARRGWRVRFRRRAFRIPPMTS